jgi:hypothetical protein
MVDAEGMLLYTCRTGGGMKLMFWKGSGKESRTGSGEGVNGTWKPPFKKDPLTRQAQRARGSLIFVAWWLLATAWIVGVLGTQILGMVSRMVVALGRLLDMNIR